jgi:serine/threonine protein kinase
LASALDHPNICTILEIVEHEGQYGIVMQNIDGKLLSQLISGKPMQEEQFLSVALQVANALEATHDKDQVKVLDSGVAKVHEQTKSRKRKGEEVLPKYLKRQYLIKTIEKKGIGAGLRNHRIIHC